MAGLISNNTSCTCGDNSDEICDSCLEIVSQESEAAGDNRTLLNSEELIVLQQYAASTFNNAEQPLAPASDPWAQQQPQTTQPNPPVAEYVGPANHNPAVEELNQLLQEQREFEELVKQYPNVARLLANQAPADQEPLEPVQDPWAQTTPQIVNEQVRRNQYSLAAGPPVRRQVVNTNEEPLPTPNHDHVFQSRK